MKILIITHWIFITIFLSCNHQPLRPLLQRSSCCITSCLRIEGWAYQCYYFRKRGYSFLFNLPFEAPLFCSYGWTALLCFINFKYIIIILVLYCSSIAFVVVCLGLLIVHFFCFIKFVFIELLLPVRCLEYLFTNRGKAEYGYFK